MLGRVFLFLVSSLDSFEFMLKYVDLEIENAMLATKNAPFFSSI